MKTVARLRLVLVAVALAVLAAAAQERLQPIVLLVGFDGWRWDYIDRASVPNLKALAASGVRARGLIPAFPSKTFPNFYTIVTGLYPEHHGIISNSMWDPEFPERFSLSSATVADPRWWGGEPLWVTAMRQGHRTASMFWPGSEAPIGGTHPTLWKPFDTTVPNDDRVRQVLDWLALPRAEQPSFITVYFSDVDSAGHDYGPDSQEVLDAARRLDGALGDLLKGVEALGLRDRLNIVIVSDHGMSQTSDERTIVLDDYLDVASVDVIDWTPIVALSPRAGSSLSVDDIYRRLRGKHPALDVYRRSQMPRRLHYRSHRLIPPVLGLAADGWTITSRQRIDADRKAGRLKGGEHGYDPKYQSMQGLFVAAGPRIRDRMVVPEFQNIHIYHFLCEILRLKPAPNDGNPRVTRGFLKN
jgi:predicted AlkP superfamily pyrophosphatase or phosphodiesterase